MIQIAHFQDLILFIKIEKYEVNMKKILLLAMCTYVGAMIIPLSAHAAENTCTERANYAIIAESNSNPLSIQASKVNIDGLVYSNCNIDSTFDIENQRDNYPTEYNISNFSSQFMIFDNDYEKHDDNYIYYGDVNVVNSFGTENLEAADSKLLVDEMFGANNDIKIASDVVSNASDDQDSIIFASNGDITIQCNMFDFDGIVYAPNGSVTISAKDVDFYGLIIAEEVMIQSDTLDIVSNNDYFDKYSIEFYTLDEVPANLNIMDAEGGSSSSSNGGSTWYYNTGTAVQTRAVYSNYKLLDKVKTGDIIHENRNWSFSSITGHIACVEGIYYLLDSKSGKYYKNIRIIEAISDGVCRSVLDDTRCDDNKVVLLRYKTSISETNMNKIINFLTAQLGKKYRCDGSRNTSIDTDNWYCSELVWAAYNYIGLDIEDGNFGFITPGDILDSDNTKKISYK